MEGRTAALKAGRPIVVKPPSCAWSEATLPCSAAMPLARDNTVGCRAARAALSFGCVL